MFEAQHAVAKPIGRDIIWLNVKGEVLRELIGGKKLRDQVSLAAGNTIAGPDFGEGSAIEHHVGMTVGDGQA